MRRAPGFRFECCRARGLAFPRSLLGALLLLVGCTATAGPGGGGEEPVPTLVTQRVTATVQRTARRLVRLSTERETLLSTPEHPFATPGSGWIRAGRLVPGDWVVSERFGAVRVLSVRSEAAARPVPVFNLSVASSQAYFVGTERVLVHNTKCRAVSAEVRAAAIERMLHEREELNREIKALTRTTPRSPKLAALRAARNRLTHEIRISREALRRSQGLVLQTSAEQSRQFYEAEHEAERRLLEATQQELAELESREPSSEAERAAFAARTAELKKQIQMVASSVESTDRILTWTRALDELKNEPSATDADRRALRERKEELQARLVRERRRARGFKQRRKVAADPEARAARAKVDRATRYRLLRTRAHLADKERPRDPLELLEDELARWEQAPPSESREAHLEHLTDRIGTMKRLVEVRRAQQKNIQRRWKLRRAREKLGGRDPSKLDQKLEQAEREFHALRIENAQLRVRERLLARLDETPWVDAPGAVDKARLRGFEAELAQGLANEQQLAGIERALDAMELPEAEWRTALLDAAHDVEEALSEREELRRQRSSPERAAGLQSSYARLERELREERAAVEAAVSALVNEHAFVQRTRASSSSGPSWQERLAAIQEEWVQLRARWRAGLQARLDSAQRQLHLLRSVEWFRDEAVEAELVREIALLERELRGAG